MHPLDCPCPSCVTRPGPVMGVMAPAVKHMGDFVGAVLAPAPAAHPVRDCIHCGLEVPIASERPEHERCAREAVPAPALCGCSESMRYRALLVRVAEDMRQRGPFLPGSHYAVLLAELREALALRGGR